MSMEVMRNTHGLWNERYRPTTLDTFVGNELLKEKLQHFLDQNDITNLLFYGPAGCGKTTLAKIIIKNFFIYCLSLVLIIINKMIIFGMLPNITIKANK